MSEIVAVIFYQLCTSKLKSILGLRHLFAIAMAAAGPPAAVDCEKRTAQRSSSSIGTIVLLTDNTNIFEYFTKVSQMPKMFYMFSSIVTGNKWYGVSNGSLSLSPSLYADMKTRLVVIFLPVAALPYRRVQTSVRHFTPRRWRGICNGGLHCQSQ